MLAKVSTAAVDEDRPVGSVVHSGLLLFLILISLPCSVFLLYQVFTTRRLFSAVHNLVIIALVAGNGIQTLIELPMHLRFWYTGIVWSPTLTYCLYWAFMEYCLFAANVLLMV